MGFASHQPWHPTRMGLRIPGCSPFGCAHRPLIVIKCFLFILSQQPLAPVCSSGPARLLGLAAYSPFLGTAEMETRCVASHRRRAAPFPQVGRGQGLLLAP